MWNLFIITVCSSISTLFPPVNTEQGQLSKQSLPKTSHRPQNWLSMGILHRAGARECCHHSVTGSGELQRQGSAWSRMGKVLGSGDSSSLEDFSAQF